LKSASKIRLGALIAITV